ncbi:HAD family hydrolase [Candidatus Pacearchaeota archaeon]|nr:HAD family hydrolase [Candidatus Pacearchaeota archaeon]
MNKTFICDLDDTLIFNQAKYSYAQVNFVKWALDSFGPRTPNAQKILQLQIAKDMKAVGTSAFSADRFPQSFADTYLELAREMGITEEEIIERKSKEAFAIGAQVHDPATWKKELIPGADEVLTQLKLRGDELYLVTTGDPAVQEKKIEFYEIGRYFQPGRIHIVPHKKDSKIEEICLGRDRRNIWFVGNSKRSDIKPALEARIGAIHIPQDTWAYEEHVLDELDTTRLTTLKDIRDLIPQYDSLK